jgi:glycosyltransferase involved in cell wall biosynthesis
MISNVSLPLTIAIITKNRPGHLDTCLNSLKNQQFLPKDRIIIIDSSKNNFSEKIIKTLRSHFPIPITYVYEPKPGFPIARNRAMIASNTEWIAFIDDDCEAKADWVSQIRKAMRKHSNKIVIAGQTYTTYRQNIFCIAVEVNELYWKYRNRDKKMITNLSTIDNKNTIYNRKYLNEHAIKYDEKRIEYNGCSEDCDHGKQIQESGGEGYFESKIIVRHKDLQSFIPYVERLFTRICGYAMYEIKWKSTQKANTKDNKMRFFIQYAKTNNLSFLFALQVSLVLFVSYFIIRIARLFVYLTYRHKITKSITPIT